MENPLGTDKLGRDILSRVLYGGRISLLVGATTVLISLAIGLAIGSLSGYFGGWADQLLMRLVDILMAFPGILLAIAFTAVLGPGLDHVILALCLIGWTSYARLVRGEILTLGSGSLSKRRGRSAASPVALLRGIYCRSSSSRAYPSHLWIGSSDYRRRQRASWDWESNRQRHRGDRC